MALIVEILFFVMLGLATVLTLFSIYNEFLLSSQRELHKRLKQPPYGNCMAWVYLLYVIAVLLTIFRAVALEVICPDCGAYFTVTYNWAATLIISVQSVIPIRLIEMRKNPMKKVDSNNFTLLLGIAGVYVVLLVITLVLVVLGIDKGLIATAWRVFFMANAALEFGLLFKCLTVFEGSSHAKRYYYFVISTVYMRGGICLAIILKHFDLASQDVMKLIHVFVVMSGLMFYNKKLMGAASKAVVSVAEKVSGKTTRGPDGAESTDKTSSASSSSDSTTGKSMTSTSDMSSSSDGSSMTSSMSSNTSSMESSSASGSSSSSAGSSSASSSSYGSSSAESSSYGSSAVSSSG